MALLDGMLVVGQIPYLRGDGTVATGSLLVPLTLSGDVVVSPATHTAWWTGEPPCEADGSPLHAINIARHEIAPTLPGRPPALVACAKPHGREFHDHREFVLTYVAILGAPVAAVDPAATARVHGRSTPIDPRAGPFAYFDTASPRAGLGWSNRTVQGLRIGIVGLGGTGSYVLDMISKCGVDAIHLFDDDVFEQHSAFRAPGAATIDDVRSRRRKVDHFASVYRGLHRRVIPHAVRIDQRTAPLLDVLDFAFVCIDDAAAKPPIMKRLSERGIPYVDAGMGLHVSERGIGGAIRTTLVTPGEVDMAKRIPTLGDPDGIYSTNIQICELNALNASLAVIAWKRHFGFYAANRKDGNGVFIVEDGRLHIEDAGGGDARTGQA